MERSRPASVHRLARALEEMAPQSWCSVEHGGGEGDVVYVQCDARAGARPWRSLQRLLIGKLCNPLRLVGTKREQGTANP